MSSDFKTIGRSDQGFFKRSSLGFRNSLGKTGVFGPFSSNHLYYTDNRGIDWNHIDLTTQEGWFANTSFGAVAYSPKLKLFSAMSGAGTGTIGKSTNGKDWILQPKGDNVRISNMIWIPEFETFIGINASNQNKVYLSSNGFDIDTINNTGTNTRDKTGITWSKELGIAIISGFIADGVGSNLLYSDDLINWNDIPVLGGLDAYSITWSPYLGLFAVCGVTSTSTGRIYISPDGTNWTLVVNDNFPNFFQIDWSVKHKKFIAIGNVSVGVGSPYTIDQVLTVSSDGTNWEKISVANNATTAWGIVKSGADGTVIAGNELTNLYYSKNLSDWTLGNKPVNVISAVPFSHIALDF